MMHHILSSPAGQMRAIRSKIGTDERTVAKPADRDAARRTPGGNREPEPRPRSGMTCSGSSAGHWHRRGAGDVRMGESGGKGRCCELDVVS